MHIFLPGKPQLKSVNSTLSRVSKARAESKPMCICGSGPRGSAHASKNSARGENAAAAAAAAAGPALDLAVSLHGGFGRTMGWQRVAPTTALVVEEEVWK